MWATRVIIIAAIIAISIAFQGIACGQSPGFTGITTDTAWIGPDNGVTVSYTLTDAACSDVYLFVYDSSSAPVRTIHAGLQSSGSYDIYWDGCLENGAHVPEGYYMLQVGAIDFASVPGTLAGQWKWLVDPCGVAVDQSGNVYVIDSNTLRLFATDGSDATLTQWDDQIPGMAVDTSGNVYAYHADTGTVYVIHPDGTAAMLATGLDNVTAMAVNATGYLYVACPSECTVMMVSPDGTVTDIGVCPQSLTAMAVSPDNVVYMVALEGDLTVILPDGTSGTAYRGLIGTSGMAVDASGNIYISSMLDHSVKKITPDRRLVTLNSQFESPAGLSVDSSGNVYVIDQGELISVPPIKFVYVIHPDGSVSRMGPAFSHPSHIAAYEPGTFYVTDYDGQIKKVTGDATTSVLDTCFYQPSIAVDASGTIYVSDKFQSSIMAISPGGSLVPVGDGFCFPMGVAVDSGGNIYVADTFNGAVKVIKDDGIPTPLGSGFTDPWDVAVDEQGNVYVTDGIEAGTVTKICPDGTQIVLASGYSFPDSIAVDKGGIVYFTDNADDAVTSVVNIIYPDGTIDALGPFPYLIYDIAVDTQGNLYVVCLDGIYMLSRPAFAGTPCTVYSDMTPPVTTCQPSGTMDSGSYAGTAHVSLSATDAGAGVKTTTYSVDGGAWTTYSEPFDVTGDGHHTVNYRSTDNVGNVEQIGETTFGIGIPDARFTVNVTSGEAPLTVHFIDQSTGNPNYWLWDLGTGARAWSINPVYTYDTPGTYTVSLTVSNGFSSDTVTKTELIHVYQATETFTIPLKQGWNLISLPLQTDSVTASSLEELGVTEVAWYDAPTGSYGIYLVGLSPDDFSLGTGQGYFLYCSRDSSLAVTGYAPSGQSETIQAGWNMAGWGTLKTVDVGAVASSLPGTQEIAKYNTASGMFDIYLEGRTPAGFFMKPGEGYFIYASEAGTLSYDSLGGA